MDKRCYQCFLFLLSCLMAACGDEDEKYHYPSVKTEFLTAFSDKEGMLQSAVTDEGTTYRITEDVSKITIRPDSLVRMVGKYEVMPSVGGNAGMKLYTWLTAVSPLPLSAERFKEGVKVDPAEVQSIWMGLNYLNIVLTVKARNETHLFHFVEDMIITDAETGQRHVFLTLYHDAKNDVPASTRRVYLSVPLRQYKVEGIRKITVHFSLHTSSGELKTYKLDYIPN